MKKFIGILLALALVFTMCVASFAEEDACLHPSTYAKHGGSACTSFAYTHFGPDGVTCTATCSNSYHETHCSICDKLLDSQVAPCKIFHSYCGMIEFVCPLN